MLSFGSFLKTAAKLRLFCRIEMPKTQIVCDNSLYFDLYQSTPSPLSVYFRALSQPAFATRFSRFSATLAQMPDGVATTSVKSLLDYADETKQDFDEILLEHGANGVIWLHFAVRPPGQQNRRKISFLKA